MANVVEFSILAKDKFSKQFASLRSTVNQTAKVAAGLGAAFAGGAAIAAKAIIDVGSTTENLRTRMNAMLGDVGEGNKVFKEMSEFASEVPFAYEEIMGAATQLSGILKGGSDEIAQTMPMIADLAAVAGLSIEKTTEQVTRLFSAGAGSADLFRERGINAMLGFEAGVAVTAEESKKRLIEAFEDPMSKFRGAAAKMATNWDGIMSMIGDKWFNIKSQIADAGLFNYFKAIAMAINDMMGQALDNTKENAVSWSNTIIDGIRAVMTAVGWLGNSFRGIEVIWDGMQLGFAKMAESIYININAMAESMRFWMNMIPGIDISKFEGLAGTLAQAKLRSKELGEELQNTLMQPLPTDQIENFVAKVESGFVKLQDMTLASNAAVINSNKKVTEETLLEFDKRLNKQIETDIKSLELATKYSTDFGEIFSNTTAEIFMTAQTLGEVTAGLIKQTFDTVTNGIGRAVGDAIVFGSDLGKAMKNLLKQVVSNIISTYVTMGVQKLLFAALDLSANTSMASAEASRAVGAAAANGIASMAMAPWPLNLGAPAFGAAMAAAAGTAYTAGAATGKALGVATIAHGGMTNVPKESTFLLDKGERVLSPNQNKDFTDFISGGGTGTGPTVIENLTVEINVESLDGMSEDELEEFVAGPLIRTLNKLDDAGVRQAALERSNV